MKKKTLTIEVNDNYQYPKKTNTKYSKDLLYKEKTEVYEQEFVLNKKLPFNDQLKVLKDNYNKLKVRIERLENDFAFYKLFKLASNVSDDKIENMYIDYVNLDKYIKVFNDRYNALQRFFSTFDGNYNIVGTQIPVKEKITDKEVEDTYEEILNLFSYLFGLRKDLNQIIKNYFHEFKLTSYGVTHNKKTSEILTLTSKVDEELKRYRNITNACDYYTFNAGMEIQDTVNEFVKLNKKYPFITYKYFLDQSAIIAFNFQEWVELFVRFNYVLNKISNSDKTEKLISKYQELEVKYTILLINSERSK